MAPEHPGREPALQLRRPGQELRHPLRMWPAVFGMHRSHQRWRLGRESGVGAL